MAQLLVRNIDDALVSALKKRAAEHGVSAEEEHRRILRKELEADEIAFNKSFMAHLLSDEDKVDDFEIPKRTVSLHRKVKF
ncbi:MAG: DNA-binding protein [Verrucomicrobiota bacterium]